MSRFILPSIIWLCVTVTLLGERTIAVKNKIRQLIISLRDRMTVKVTYKNQICIKMEPHASEKKWWRKWISGIMRSSLEKIERHEIIEICSNRVSPLITLFRNNFYDHKEFNCYPTQFFRLFPAFSCSFPFPLLNIFLSPKS